MAGGGMAGEASGSAVAGAGAGAAEGAAEGAGAGAGAGEGCSAMAWREGRARRKWSALRIRSRSAALCHLLSYGGRGG